MLDVHQQEALAAWAAMFVMVAEYFDPYKVATMQTQRNYLMENQKPPPNWKIWFGDLDEKSRWPSLLAHFAVPISSPEVVQEVMENGFPRPNTQTMTFRVGRLYVHVRSSVTDIFDNWRFAGRGMLAQIWPLERNIVAWPPKFTLSDRDADAIASHFHLASDEVGRRMASGK